MQQRNLPPCAVFERLRIAHSASLFPVQTILAILLSALLAGVTYVTAQEATQPAPPPSPGGKEGRRFGGGLGMPPFGRGPWSQDGAGFGDLSEPEKKRVRAALEAAWQDAEVARAREQVMAANDTFRKAMHAAVEKSDPEAAKILAKIRPPSPWDVLKDRMRMPRPDDPKFDQAALSRLEMELLHVTKPEHRDAARRLHQRVVKMPELIAAYEAMKNAQGEAKMAAFKALGEQYKSKVEQALQEIRNKHAAPPAPAPPAR
jgi:hypothetical protein